jgi:serine/threonine protein kinase
MAEGQTNPGSGLPALATPMELGHFDLGVTLGTGSFGRVRFVTHKTTGSHWAIKMLKKAEVIRLQQVEHMLSEKAILACLDHPFIVKLAGTFQDKKYLYMVLEYIVGGEFFTHLRKAGRFENPVAKFYAAQIVTVFEYLHNQDFIYRDLKPENLLLDVEGYVKITDFGFAKRVAFKTYTLCGTPEYIAPEVLLNKGHGKGVDWWTLGILIFEMLGGQPPFVDDDPMGIYQQILAGKVNFPRFFERNAKNLIKKLLTADLTKRFGCLKNGAEDIRKHKWFSGLDY